MTNTKLWGVAVVALIIAIVGLFTPATVSTVRKLAGTTNYDALQLDSGNLTLKSGTVSLTSSGPQIYALEQSLTAATTTPCDLTVTATSSILGVDFDVTTGTSSASIVTYATSTLPNATTTAYNTFKIPANALGRYHQIATTTDASVLYPNTHIVFGVAGVPIYTTGGYGGTCSALLLKP